jgi:drug/metabolite transporter (DMT)-like permease
MVDGALISRPGMMSTELLVGYRKGLLLTLAGTIIASFEGLLVRLVGLDSWGVIFWRGLGLGFAMMAFILLTGRRIEPAKLGRPAWIAILAYAVNVFCFISAINTTTVANTLVIASAAPVFAAALGWLFLRERPSKETWIAVLVVLVGLAIIFWGSLSTTRIQGDGFALGYALSLAAYFVALQRCADREIPVIVTLGGFLSALPAWPLASGLAIPVNDLWAMALLALMVVPAATLLLSWGPQLIPASHVTLIMLLEIGLGPLWVWLVLSEVPAGATVLGGALVLATIVVHSRLMAQESRGQAARAAQG